jgi:hypothetical protein
MHPRTRELLDHLTTHRATLRAALDAVSPAERERQPAPDRWSAAQVLEHLAIVEGQIAALLKRGLRRALADGVLPADLEHAPVVPSIDAQALLDRERTFAARPEVSPSHGWTAAHAWAELERSRTSLREVLLAADGLDTRAIRAPHPFLGALTFHQWIAFAGFHEARHAAQIRALPPALA